MNGILSTLETSKQFCELDNVTRASIHKVVSTKWVKFQFSVNYPLSYTLH